MSKLQGLMWAVSHAAERRFRMPTRAREWAGKREPFVHTARHGLSFELVPGEYVDQHIYVEGIFERRFLDGLHAYFTRHPGDVMLDVGCNIGNHSCFLADRFRAVHAFDAKDGTRLWALQRPGANNARDKCPSVAPAPACVPCGWQAGCGWRARSAGRSARCARAPAGATSAR